MVSILHLIPTLEGGGAERQLSMLAAEQSRRGGQIHVGVRRAGVYAEILRANGVSIQFLGDHGGIHPLLLQHLNALIKQIKPDIIHTWLPQMDIIGGMTALWNSVPWILSERTSELAFKSFSVRTVLRQVLVRRSNAVIANSAGGAAYWYGQLGPSAAVFQIGNAINVEAIRRASSGQHLPSNNASPQLLVVGRLVPEKAVEIIVQAVQLVPANYDFHISIIGEGRSRPEIERAIKVAGLDQRISLISFQPDWWNLLARARALISMSRYEGQPNVVLETMVAQCPLIVSDIPAHREFLDDTSAILVPTDNPVALAGAIVSVLEDPMAARHRAKRASSVVAKMTIQLAADAYERVYQRAMSRIPK